MSTSIDKDTAASAIRQLSHCYTAFADVARLLDDVGLTEAQRLDAIRRTVNILCMDACDDTVHSRASTITNSARVLLRYIAEVVSQHPLDCGCATCLILDGIGSQASERIAQRSIYAE